MPAAQEVFLQPGDVFVGDARYRVRTLLGSCVSMVFWHPQHRIGAMCHFVLPHRGGMRECEPDGRYGDEALELVLGGLRGHGVDPRECAVKLFGGGDMLGAFVATGAGGVGRANGMAAHALLARHGCPVVAESLYGFGYRRIRLDVSSGEVRMWKGRPVAAPDAAGVPA